VAFENFRFIPAASLNEKKFGLYPANKYTIKHCPDHVIRDNIAYLEQVIYLTFGDKKRPSE